MSKLQEGV